MPFCPQCGAPVEEHHRFCTSCGASLSGEPCSRKEPEKPHRKNFFSDGSTDSAVTLGWVFLASLGGLGLVSLLFQDVLGFVLALGFAGGAYLLVLKPLLRGDRKSPILPVLVIAVVVSIIGIAVLLVTRSMMGILDVAAAVPGYLLWKALQE